MDCSAYTKFHQVVKDAKHHNLNATDYVARCEDACLVLFGSGNPDISGIGVMIAFCVQATAVVLSGPFIPLVLFARYRRWLSPIYDFKSSSIHHRLCLCPFCRSHFNEPFKRAVYSVSQRTFTAHLLCALPLAIAAIVRFAQSPPILEDSYLSWLINTQMLLTITVNQFYDKFFGNDGSMPWLALGYGLQSMLSLIAIISSTRSGLPSEEHKRLSTACHQLRGTVDILHEYGTPGLLSWKIIPAVAYVCMALLQAIWVWLPDASVNRIRNGLVIMRLDGRRMRRCGKVTYQAAVILFPTHMVIANYATLFRHRDNIQRMAGDRFEDNSWGIGQILAIGPWVWFFIKGIFRDMRKILSDEHGVRAGTLRQTTENRIDVDLLKGTDQLAELLDEDSSRASVVDSTDPGRDGLNRVTTTGANRAGDQTLGSVTVRTTTKNHDNFEGGRYNLAHKSRQPQRSTTL